MWKLNGRDQWVRFKELANICRALLLQGTTVLKSDPLMIIFCPIVGLGQAFSNWKTSQRILLTGSIQSQSCIHIYYVKAHLGSLFALLLPLPFFSYFKPTMVKGFYNLKTQFVLWLTSNFTYMCNHVSSLASCWIFSWGVKRSIEEFSFRYHEENFLCDLNYLPSLYSCNYDS